MDMYIDIYGHIYIYIYVYMYTTHLSYCLYFNLYRTQGRAGAADARRGPEAGSYSRPIDFCITQL